jgi:Xaa-Pro dipeptidase
MGIHIDRIQRAQELMREQGMIGLMIMNHDDYRYFFGQDWAQPRAIIPFEGKPVLISFKEEEPLLRAAFGNTDVELYAHVGGMIRNVTSRFSKLLKTVEGQEFEGKPRVGMQMLFDTPAFLVDLFRQVNPRIDLVSSDPVMDQLRMQKQPEEVQIMIRSQEIAGMGMACAREALRPGVSAQEVAAEALYVMMKAGAEGTSTPMHINFGASTSMLHGGLSLEPLKTGEMVVVDLTPQLEGYCANLARTFVIGQPDDTQRRLYDTYQEMVAATCSMMRPGLCVQELDNKGKEICTSRGFGEQHIDGISHGIGLRFEETPSPTIVRQHRKVLLQEGMTVTIGHTVLAVPGVGGIRHEDVYLLTADGPQMLAPYQGDFIIQ